MAVVVLLDSDSISVKLLRLILEKGGHSVLTATDTEHAWGLLWENVLVDLIIMDIQLADNTAYIFMEELRIDPIFCKMPIVVTTCQQRRSHVRRCMNFGVQHYLLKPISARKIGQVMDRYEYSDPFDRYFEDSSIVCERMGLAHEEYQHKLWEVGEIIRNACITLHEACIAKDAEKLLNLLFQLQSSGITLGYNLLSQLCTSLETATQRTDYELVRDYLPHMELLATLAEFKHQCPDARFRNSDKLSI